MDQAIHQADLLGRVVGTDRIQARVDLFNLVIQGSAVLVIQGGQEDLVIQISVVLVIQGDQVDLVIQGDQWDLIIREDRIDLVIL